MAQQTSWPPEPPRRPMEYSPPDEGPAAPPQPPRRPAGLRKQYGAPPEVFGPPAAPVVQTPAPLPDYSFCVALFDSGHVRAERTRMPSEKSECAIADGVTLHAVKLANGTEVSLAGGVTVRCAFALTVARWVREDIAPRIAADGIELKGLSGIGGLVCRTRNHQPNAKVSEHARGAALDVRGLQTSAGTMDLTKADAATKALREDLKKAFCARFSTVLGPGSDPFHSDHIHVDMAERRGGYRMCQWNVE